MLAQERALGAELFHRHARGHDPTAEGQHFLACATEVEQGTRNARPEQIGLAGRRLVPVEFAGYGGAGTHAPLIRVMGQTPSALWTAQRAGPSPRIETAAALSAYDLAGPGCGTAVLPTFIGDACSELARVTDPIPELTHDQWLVTHDSDRFDPPVRRTFDRIIAILTDAMP